MITCLVCNCTDENACVDPATGETCAWVEIENDVYDINGMGLCTVCADDAPREVQDEVFLELMQARLASGFNKPSDAERDAPLVELVSDAEADRFLRARRAGA